MKNFLQVFVVLALFSITTTSFAQKFGVKAGFNMSTLLSKDDDETYSSGFKLKPGFQLGVIGEFPFSDNFSLGTGLLFTTKGFREKETDYFLGDPIEIKAKTSLNYLELPITPKITFGSGDSKFFLAAGPYLAYALSGKSKAEGTYQGHTEKEDQDIDFGSGDDEMKRFDFGLNASGGVEINHMQIGLTYDFGLANLSNYTDNGTKVKNRVLGLFVAYTFGD